MTAHTCRIDEPRCGWVQPVEGWTCLMTKCEHDANKQDHGFQVRK